MFYEEIILDGCNRTALNGKRRVVIRPTSRVQLVLGTNSSGKSSLLEIGFCCFPPDPHNFDKPGFWSVKFTHKGRHYYQTAEYGEKTNRYSFVVDGGENLNPGGTITMQMELVKQYIGYDKDLHAFLLGLPKARFTQMDSKRRQHWIAKFSSHDFAYAFDRYNHYKKQANAANHNVAYLRSELAELKRRMLEPEDIQAMRDKAKELHDTLDMLLLEPKSNTEDVDPFEILCELDKTIDKMVSFLCDEYPDTVGARDMNELTQMKVDIENHLNTLQGELNVRGQRLSDCMQRKGRAEALTEVSPEKITEELQRLRTELTEVPELRTGLHETLLVPIGQAAVELRQIVGELPNERPDTSGAVAMQETIHQSEIRLGKIMALLDGLKAEAAYIHKCEEVECPDCHSKFKPGIKPGELEALAERIKNGEVMTESQTKRLYELYAELKDIHATIDAYRRLDTFREQYGRAYSGLFQFFDQFGWKDLGKEIVGKLAIYEGDVQTAVRRGRLTNSIKNLEDALQNIKLEAGDLANAFADYDEAFEEYNLLFQKIEDVKRRKARISTAYSQMQMWEGKVQDCERSYEDMRRMMIEYMNRQGDHAILELIKKTKVTLGIHEAALNENETYETLAKDMTNKLEKALVRKEAYDGLTAALSPKTGLIAEHIQNQLGGILGHANQQIEAVWGYSLAINVGEVGEAELDYKFPMVVGDTPRPDISVGSSSVRDIIDQVMRLTGYSCMNLQDYPLFVDELGGTFDATHKQNLIPFLKSLIDDPRYSQVLMISHSLNGQTAFPGAEVIILDDRNIVFPHKYNQHVEFS